MPEYASSKQPFPRLSFLVAVACLLGICLLFYPPVRHKILSLEPWTADWRTALLSDRIAEVNDKAVIVTINDKILETQPYRSPTPRDLLAKVVEAVDAAGAK